MEKAKGANGCSRCGKPVYFAERKTSLGKDWHPNCLRCEQCGKILTPGQHAERKGVPYCHKPCYGALFGPQILGYGSNVSSPANFRKSGDLGNESESLNTSANDDSNSDGIKCVFKTTNTSPGPLKFQRRSADLTPPRLQQKRHSSGSIETGSSSSGYHSNSGSSSLSGSSSGLESVGENGDSGLKMVYQSGSKTLGPGDLRSPTGSTGGDRGTKFSPPRAKPSQARGAELFKRVQSYNEFHQNKRGQALAIVEDENTGNVRVQGPLRIYWGLKKPIMLKQFDEVPSAPAPRKRFSVISDQRDLKPLPEMKADSNSPTSPRKLNNGPGGGGGFDDSILSSPGSDVVMRRTNIKKSNTVAYRGDSSKFLANRWKRASINGHIYNYDTSVFTPVLGSCTSVTVDNKMTVQQVIKTLLDKFKVENEPEDFHLSIVTEKESSRLLRESDIPLLERLSLGPSDSVKIFIQDKSGDQSSSSNTSLPSAHIPGAGDVSPTTEAPVQETPLPEEVEQLLDLPEPVLRGILDKFKGDEEKDVRLLKAKYERIRRRVQQIIDDKKSNQSRC